MTSRHSTQACTNNPSTHVRVEVFISMPIYRRTHTLSHPTTGPTRKVGCPSITHGIAFTHAYAHAHARTAAAVALHLLPSPPRRPHGQFTPGTCTILTVKSLLSHRHPLPPPPRPLRDRFSKLEYSATPKEGVNRSRIFFRFNAFAFSGSLLPFCLQHPSSPTRQKHFLTLLGAGTSSCS